MIANTKLLLIGQAASGKSTLSRALAKRLALPCYRIDDYRRWLGDNSIAADYRVRAAFLDACSSEATGIFEFSAVGHHRDAVRLAMQEHSTPLTIVNVECDEDTRQARLRQRKFNTPYPGWGVGPEYAAIQQINRLKQDISDAFWTTEPNWKQIQVRGDQRLEHAFTTIINHLGVRPETSVSQSAQLTVASTEWMADVLRLPASIFTSVKTGPVAHHSTTNSTWEVCSPEVDKYQLQDLLSAFEQAGWHTLLVPAQFNMTRLAALSPNLERYVEVNVRQHCVSTAATHAAEFAHQLERASEGRARSDATAWFFGTSAALQSLTHCWSHAQGNTSTDNHLPLARQLPEHLKLLHRNSAPSLDLAHAAIEADSIYNFSTAVLTDIRQHKSALLAVSILESWLPVLRSIFDARDALWNIRDVSENTAGFLRKGVLFRGSSPTRYHHDSRYAGSGLFERWRQSTGVNQIIDLRTVTEASLSPYPTEWLSTLAVSHQPTEGHLLQQRGDLSPKLEQEYLAFFESYPAVFKNVVLCIAETKQPVLVHCFAGIYRTGVVVAVLCYLCNLPRALIVHDYLVRGDSARPECIEIILNRLEQIGNPQALACHLDIDDRCLAAFRKRLIV